MGLGTIGYSYSIGKKIINPNGMGVQGETSIVSGGRIKILPFVFNDCYFEAMSKDQGCF